MCLGGAAGRGGSGDEAGGREGALGPGRWTHGVEHHGEGSVVTWGAGAWPGGHTAAALSSRSERVPCRHRPGAAGACGCFKETEHSDASKQSGFSDVDS